MHESFNRRSKIGTVAPLSGWVLLTIVLLGLVPSSALSHAILLESSPAPDAVVPAPPRLVLRFNSRVEARLSSVLLVGGPRQMRVVLTSPRADDPDSLIYSLPELSPGQYRAEWKAMSVDGHVTDGVVPFTVIEVSR
jgi:methionine-rich copper-binding protein CopC